MIKWNVTEQRKFENSHKIDKTIITAEKNVLNEATEPNISYRVYSLNEFKKIVVKLIIFTPNFASYDEYIYVYPLWEEIET